MLLLLMIMVSSPSCTGKTLWSWSYESHQRDINELLKEKFEYTDKHGQFGIGADASLSLAPSPTHDGYVLRVFYQKGSFSGHGSHSGAQFYASPHGVSGHTTLTLEYQVYFNESFPWKQGGKLPGLWGGARTCSGGRLSDACFSTRLMWRENGAGEVYAYVTQKQPTADQWNHFCHANDHLGSHEKYRQIHCSPGYGISLGAGSFTFRPKHWFTIRQEVHLNSHPDQPGYVKLWVDNHAEIHVTNMIMRHTNQFAIDGLFFSTFYGGHESDWACPHDTYTYFRNFRISTDVHTPSTSQLVG